MVREAPVAMFVICKLILSGNGDIYVDFCVQRRYVCIVWVISTTFPCCKFM